MKKTILAVVVILLITGAAFIWLGGSNDTDQSTNKTAQTNQSTTSSTPTENPPAAGATITYTDNGFTPGTLTVKSGTEIKIVNSSSSSIQFSSDPHPEHTDAPELNQDSLAPGASQTIKAGNPGTYGVHNHEDPTKTMTIIVQ